MSSIKARPGGGFRARYRDAEGKEHARHFALKRDAQGWLDSVASSVQLGTYVDPKAGRLTVKPWSETWQANQPHWKATTRARYAGIVTNHVLPRWGDVRLADITHTAIQAWVVQLGVDGLEAASVRKVYRVLSLMLSAAVKDGRLARNPGGDVNLPRVASARRHYLTHEQVAKLAELTARRKDDTRASAGERAASDSYRLVVLVLAYTGLRWGELAALRVGSLDLLRRRIEVSASVVEVNGRLEWGTPKDHESRSVPIPKFLADELASHVVARARDDLLFTGVRGGRVLRNRVFRRAGFDRAAEAIGVPDLVPHALRHTAASLAIAAGANVKAVQRMLGHASAAVTLDVYADLFDDDLDAVADRLDRAVRLLPADFLRTGGPGEASVVVLTARQ